jgi:hypothetical protein
MALPSSQFKRVYFGDEANTLAEYTTYVRQSQQPRGNSAINATTFNSGGDPVTSRQLKGAKTSTPSVEFMFDPTLLAVLMRIIGSRTGSTWKFFESNANAAPVEGDMAFCGTFTVFGLNINYAVGQDATIQVDLAPTDGGTITPDWYAA